MPDVGGSWSSNAVSSEAPTTDPRPPTPGEAIPSRNNGGILSLLLFLAPIVLAGALMAYFNYFKTGNPLPPTSSEAGRTDHFFWPWGGLEDLTKFVTAAFGTLFDDQFGLLTYAPVYLLAVVGIIAMIRSGRRADRRILFWLALIAIPYMTLITAYEGWHGVWCPPARYAATFAPLLGGPLAMSLFALSRSWLSRFIYVPIFVFLSLLGSGAMYVMMADSRLMWPTGGSPVFIWVALDQSSPFKVELRNFLASFTSPNQVTHPMNTGWMTGVVLLAALLGYIAMSFQGQMRSRRKWPVVAQSGLWLSSIAIVAAAWFVMNYDYLQHKTVLTERGHWVLSPPPLRPFGIAYKDGKVYVSGYGDQNNPGGQTGGSLGVLDVATGAYTLMQPVSEQGPLAFAHPGDVKVGPDGLLYVLNNGDGQDALYVMKPDGQVVRRISLDSKTPISVGLAFGPDGSIYVADMLGGKIGKWGKDGGGLAGVYGGVSGGLNNPAGVAVASDGTVFAADSFNRIQHLDAQDKLLYEYDLKCHPIHMVMSGDWIETTCGSGVLSINTKERRVQLGRFSPEGAIVGEPTGLAYGDGNMLFVLDGAQLVVYEVQR
jgi:DNA-binding beta-propeller fold protein YncE